MGNATDSFFSVSHVAPPLPPIAFYHPAALAAPIPSSHYRNVNKIGAGNVAV